MFSLQKFLGKDDQFFALLEASAEETRSSVQHLVELLKTPDQPKGLEDFVLSRRKDKRITEQISEELVKTFFTALEREDIESLSIALYKIPKTVEKFAERFSILAPHLTGVDFSRQAEMMAKAAETLVAMVKQLRDLQHLEKIKELNDRLQYIEGEADKLMVELIRELYNGRYQPMQVIIIKDLYELMEKVIDRCRDAGNVVSQIVLKNS
ncbi:MAG: DUF47 family protein [Verrucomicrobia bacterium]|nr:DUF47 family protein [Verrucomicrobiota bacterium]